MGKIDLLIYCVGVGLISGFMTWIFTYRSAEKKGFEAGYQSGHSDALQSVKDGRKVVGKIKEKSEASEYGTLTAELIGGSEK